MPVVYAPQAPIAGAYAATRQLADVREQDRLAAAARGGGGGFNMGQYASALLASQGNDADRMQAAISNRDRQAFEIEKFGASINPSPRDVYLSAAEGAQQRERFQLQAELQQSELTQQEAMRLQRMKNALGEVANDPTLTDQEKADYSVMLKTGINPLEQRAAKTRAQMMEIEKSALAERYQAQAAAEQARLQTMTQGFDGLKAYHVEPEVIATIVEDLKANLGPAAAAIPGGEVGLVAMANEIAKRQGLGKTVYQQSPGRWADMSGGSSGSRGGEGRGASTHPTGLDEEAYNKIVDTVISSVDKKVEATNADGARLNPELATPEGRAKAIESELAVRLELLKKFRSEGSPKGYTSPWAKRSEATRQGSRQFKADLSDATPQQKQRILTIDQALQQALQAPGVKDGDTRELNTLAAVAKEIVRKNTRPDGQLVPSSQKEQDEFVRAMRVIADFAAKRKSAYTATGNIPVGTPFRGAPEDFPMTGDVSPIG